MYAVSSPCDKVLATTNVLSETYAARRICLVKDESSLKMIWSLTSPPTLPVTTPTLHVMDPDTGADQYAWLFVMVWRSGGRGELAICSIWSAAVPPAPCNGHRTTFPTSCPPRAGHVVTDLSSRGIAGNDGTIQQLVVFRMCPAGTCG